MDSGYLKINSEYLDMDSGHLVIKSIHLEMDSRHQDMAVRNLEMDSRHMRWVLDKWKCNIATCRLTLATWTWILVWKWTRDRQLQTGDMILVSKFTLD